MASREIFIFIILFSPGDLAHVINRAKENGVEKVSCNMCIAFFFLKKEKLTALIYLKRKVIFFALLIFKNLIIAEFNGFDKENFFLKFRGMCQMK